MKIAYCTNVHSGPDWPNTAASLQRHAQIRHTLALDGPLPIGLWLNAPTAQRLVYGGADFMLEFLHKHRLAVTTMNAFPYGFFHADVVKKDVYRPDWGTGERMDYTRNCARLLSVLLPKGLAGSLSTLPVGWPSDNPAETQARKVAAGAVLRSLTYWLAKLEDMSGHRLTVDLEPEPGCILSTALDAVRFFEEHLLGHGQDDLVRRYLGVCHDICHAAVMFEDQEAVLRGYADAGIRVGKVQISNALAVELSGELRQDALRRLGAFAEDRYLHQTMLRGADGELRFFEDLPQALREARANPAWVEARVHFHVPLHLWGFGPLRTTQPDIEACFRALRQQSFSPANPPPSLEVETYAWDVLPKELNAGDRWRGIEQELRWIEKQGYLPEWAAS